jgi:hypothetical protein
VVQVRAYDRADGTHVRAHERSAPDGRGYASGGTAFGGLGVLLALCVLWVISQGHLFVTIPQPHGAPALRLPAATGATHGGGR